MCFPDMDGAQSNFSEHPYRRDMVREMHLRRFAPVTPRIPKEPKNSLN